LVNNELCVILNKKEELYGCHHSPLRPGSDLTTGEKKTAKPYAKPTGAF
jgi:hypothetical protein